MVTIQVFDPALCCSTGVCGVEVDPQLVTFAADVDWLAEQGVKVERFNLAQQPQAFVDHSAIRQLLVALGESALPAILVNGELRQSSRYPTRDQLAQWAGIVPADSLFTEQVAELVAIGASIASNCEPCFKFHYDRARRLGVPDADMRRAVDLAQKVKEAPARAVLELAHRVLDKEEVRPAGAALSSIGVKSSGGCCAPAPGAAKSPASKCC